ncbi:MAG TPA: tyrosine-type recombinase/integrase [Myxococcales bacterium]
MSYAYTKPGSSVIYLGFKDASGRRVQQRSAALTLTEGRRLARDLERKAERIRDGLEAAAPTPTTFAALAKRYLDEVASQKRSEAHIKSRCNVHLVPEIGARLLSEIRAGDVEGFLSRKSTGGLKPQTVEHLRRTLHAILGFGIRAGLLRGENPIAAVPRRKIAERAIRVLEPALAAKVVASVPARWRNLFATAVLTAARKGELFAARPADVDLEHRTLRLEGSHAGPTKSGKVRSLPISDELAPFLADALEHTRGGFLFPGPNGKRLSKYVNLAEILRDALVAAGVIDHWDLKCRRQGCSHVEQSAEKKSLSCPKCGFALWPVAIPPTYQFKDLRSTWATLAVEATGDLRFVQAGLGHSDPRVTERHYAAVRSRHLGEQANKVHLGLHAPVAATPAPRPATYPALTGAQVPQNQGPKPPGNPLAASALGDVGATGVEPAAFGFGGSSGTGVGPAPAGTRSGILSTRPSRRSSRSLPTSAQSDCQGIVV